MLATELRSLPRDITLRITSNPLSLLSSGSSVSSDVAVTGLHRKQVFLILPWGHTSFPPHSLQRLRRFKCLQMLPFCCSSDTPPCSICRTFAHCTHCLSRLPCGPDRTCESCRFDCQQKLSATHFRSIALSEMHFFSGTVPKHFKPSSSVSCIIALLRRPSISNSLLFLKAAS